MFVTGTGYFYYFSVICSNHLYLSLKPVHVIIECGEHDMFCVNTYFDTGMHGLWSVVEPIDIIKQTMSVVYHQSRKISISLVSI